LAPVLLLIILFLKKQKLVYCKSILAAMNVGLLFFVVFACREYYGLYQLAKSFGFDITFKGMMHLFLTNIPSFTRNVLILIVPFLFLFKKLSGNVFLSVLMLVLIWWDVFYAFFTHQEVQMLGSNYAPFLFPVLNYFSLIVGMYAFLWLTKRLHVKIG
jgi:hypothetical protein